jgi:Ca2+-binding EF-hand superfamily protein
MIRMGIGLCISALAFTGCGASSGSDGASPTSKDATLALGSLPRAAAARLTAADFDHDGHLTARELARYRTRQVQRLFELLDANHDGKLEVAELPAQLRVRLATVDRDGDGVITRHELAVAHNARWRDGLRLADRNGDGAFTRDEVGPVRWLRIRAADTDHDGQVTSDELARAFHDAPGMDLSDRSEETR